MVAPGWLRKNSLNKLCRTARCVPSTQTSVSSSCGSYSRSASAAMVPGELCPIGLGELVFMAARTSFAMLWSHFGASATAASLIACAAAGRAETATLTIAPTFSQSTFPRHRRTVPTISAANSPRAANCRHRNTSARSSDDFGPRHRWLPEGRTCLRSQLSLLAATLLEAGWLAGNHG